MPERTCVVDDCDSPTVGRSWCRKHYGRWHRHGDPLRERPQRMCEVPGCAGRNFGHGLCEMHYTRRRNHGTVDPRPDSRRKHQQVGEDRRVCIVCNESLPEDSFHRDKTRWDGFARQCKSCRKAAKADYRADPEVLRARAQWRRAKKLAPDAERFFDVEIFERDSWICGVCNEGIEASLRFPHPMSASLDHVIPLTRGGNHTRANCQASHLLCNQRKGARLVGRDSQVAG